MRAPVVNVDEVCPMTDEQALAKFRHHAAVGRECLEIDSAPLDARIAVGRALLTLEARVAVLAAEALRYYNADGTFVVMESAEAVREARKRAAVRLAALAAECRAARVFTTAAQKCLEIDVRALEAIKRVPHRDDVAGDTYVAWQDFTNAVVEGDEHRPDAVRAAFKCDVARAATDAAHALDGPEGGSRG